MKVDGIVVHHETGSYLLVVESTTGGVARCRRVDLPVEDSFGTASSAVADLAWISFEEEDDITEIVILNRPTAEEVVLKYRKKGGSDSLEAESPSGVQSVDIQALLGTYAPQSQRIASDRDARIIRFDGTLTFRNPAYLEEFATRQLSADRGRTLRELRDAARSAEHFVNPYNFVPLPPDDTCARSLPQGHHQLASGNYSGTLTLKLTADSPLLMRTLKRSDNTWVALRRGDRVVIPGSTLKGAIRSLHETLAGGCLRVFDGDYIPSYRQQAATKPEPWTLGVVRVTDGQSRPTDVQLCDMVVWVRADVLKSRLGDIATGTTCSIEPDSWEWRQQRQRHQVNDATSVSSGTGWVVLLTPEGARNGKHPYYAAVGRLSSTSGEVSLEAFVSYQQAVDNADDVVKRRRKETPDLVVNFNRTVIGGRQEVARELPVGTVIWAKPERGVITEVSRSVIWRTAGKGSARERIPNGYLPCSHSEELCPSCQIFGSADDSTARHDSQRFDTHNYRSHIRIGDAISTSAIAEPDMFELAAASAPRPGSGQFYLRDNGARPAGSNTELPTFQWGSRADNGQLRRLNGRKYYWPAHTGPDGKVHRHRRYPTQTNKMTTTAELVASGTEFEVPIRFENLTPEQLGGLIAACDPNTCLSDARAQLVSHAEASGGPQRRLTIRLGGGKPLGLGVMAPTIMRLDVHTTRSRYRRTATDAGTSFGASDRDNLVARFAAGTHDGVIATWPALAALLDPGYVNADRVAYPPLNDWETMEASDHPNPWEPNHPFFKKTSGTHPNGYLPLPPATNPDQYLPINPEDDDR